MINFDQPNLITNQNERFASIDAKLSFGIRKILRNGNTPRVYFPKILIDYMHLDKVHRKIFLNVATSCIYNYDCENTVEKQVIMPPSQNTGYMLLPLSLMSIYPEATHIRFDGKFDEQDHNKIQVYLTFLKENI